MRLSKTDIWHIILPPVAVTVVFVVSFFAVFLPSYEQSLMNKKKEMIRELTNSTWSILVHYDQLARQGVLTEAQARTEASDRIRYIRYGTENKDYFWINDMQPVMIMHPYRPDLEGQDISRFTDPGGNHLFVDFVRTVETQGAGYVSYLWQWKDDATRIVPKLSYVRGFAPWGWIIGTGIYLDDVETEITALSRSLLLFAVIAFATVLTITFMIVRHGLKITDRHRLAQEQLQQHRDQLEALILVRTEELHAVNQDLQQEIEERKQAQDKERAEHSFLETVIESLPFPFYVIDATDYTIIKANTKGQDPAGQRDHKCYAVSHGRSTPCRGDEHLCPLTEVKRTRQPVTVEHIHQDNEGNKLYVEVHGYPILDAQGHIVQMIEFALDITNRKQLEEKLRQAAITDTLTGLYNRSGFMVLTQKQLTLLKRMSQNAFVLFVDLDNMKQINDTYGHDIGDQALIATARLLKDTFREADIICRLGGDEFAAFLFEASSPENHPSVVKRLEQNITALNASKVYPFSLAMSCGVVAVDKKQSLTLDALLQQADTLMYENKRKKKETASRLALDQ